MPTQKQRKFVAEYLIDLNATQAAIRAGYSARTADRIGPELLGKTWVSQAIAEGVKAREQRTEVTQDRVLLEIARLAFNDPRKAFNPDGSMKPINEWPDEVAAAVSSIEVDVLKGPAGEAIGETQKIKFWDKGKQLDLAARHLGMLNDKLNLSGAVDINVASKLDALKTQAANAKCRQPSTSKTS